MPRQPSANPALRGILYACASFALVTGMQALGKLLTGQHNVIEIAFYRNLFSLVPCVIYIAASRRYDLIATQMPGTLLLRVIAGTIGLVLIFAAAQALPLSNATVIFFTTTLLIPVLAHFFLKERIGPHRWAAILFGFCGVLLVTQPTAQVTMVGIALAFTGAVMHAIVQILLRAMRTEPAFTVTFYFFLGGTILPGVFMPFFAHMPTLHNLLILLGIGVMGGLAQYFITSAYQYAQASLIAPFNYTGLIWASLFDILLWGHFPAGNVYAGAAIIIAAQAYILHRERLKSQTAEQAI